MTAIALLLVSGLAVVFVVLFPHAAKTLASAPIKSNLKSLDVECIGLIFLNSNTFNLKNR